MLSHQNNTNNPPNIDSHSFQGLDPGSSMLYDAINKNLKKQPCRVHDLNVEYFYNQTLLCQACFQNQLGKLGRTLRVDQVQKYEYLYHLKRIINYPIILLAEQQSLFQYPIHIIDLLLKSYQPLYSKNSDFSMQKELLNAFITRVKNKINMLCDQMLACFSKIEDNLSNIRLRRDEMKDISKMYEQHFVELLQEKYVSGSLDEFQQVLRDFTNNNVNPFDKIYSNLDEVMSYLAQSPIINTHNMNKLYATITDQSLWKAYSIVTTKNQESKSKDNNELIIMNNSEIILQSQYVLQVTQNGLTLSRDNDEISKLDVSFDSLYHYSKYRLIGVNYDSIQIISYLDKLNVDQIYRIEGCTDLLSFDHYIVAVSNQNLVKIDLIQRTQSILGEDFSELQYISKEQSLFSCMNSKGKRIEWNLLSPSHAGTS